MKCSAGFFFARKCQLYSGPLCQLFGYPRSVITNPAPAPSQTQPVITNPVPVPAPSVLPPSQPQPQPDPDKKVKND